MCRIRFERILNQEMTKERNKIYNVTKLVSFAFSFKNESYHGNCYEYQAKCLVPPVTLPLLKSNP